MRITEGKEIIETQESPTDSFFEFFSPTQALVSDTGERPDESDEWLRTMDFKIGERLRDEIIPCAVYWYTGEAAEDLQLDDGLAKSDDEGSDDWEMDSSD